MKKTICLLLVLCILFCFGCANTEDGDETTADPSDEETSFDLESYTPKWHLSETISSELYIPRKTRAIKIPKTVYEEDINGFHFHVDFFETIYPEGSKMQYRATITNNSGSAIRYDAKAAVGMICGNGQEKQFDVVIPDISILSDYTDVRTFEAGETLVYEGLIRSPAVEPGKYTFEIRLVKSRNESKKVIFTCNIDVVELD